MSEAGEPKNADRATVGLFQQRAIPGSSTRGLIEKVRRRTQGDPPSAGGTVIPTSAVSVPAPPVGHRLSVNINEPTAQALRQIAARDGINYTEAVRQAVGLLAFVHEKQDAGMDLVIREPGTRKAWTIHLPAPSTNQKETP